MERTKRKTHSMRRNKFLRSWFAAVVLAVLALCVSVVLAGDQARHYQVAVFTNGLTASPVLEGLQEGLAQLGYVEGKNVTLIIEDTHGVVSNLAQRAVRLTTAKPDVLVTVGTIHTTAARQATDHVPIVFTYVGDPLRSGLVASYASSQNNLTGISVYSGPLSGKRLELLQEIAPDTKRILALVAAKESIAESSFQALDETAKKLGIQVLRRDVTTREEIEQVLQDTPAGAVDAIYHVPSALMSGYVDLLIQKAKQEKLPLMVHEDSMVQQGALASYGANFRLMGAQTAKLVAKILQGAKPSEMPIQTPDTMLLTINLTTAKAIGLELPVSILERADRLLE
jgi:putative tryptophan/tyrosine transport system substrate-binding protein